MFNNHVSDTNSIPIHGTPHLGEGDMEYINLQHTSRLGFPITLQQGTATEEDLYTHAKLRQELSHNTIIKHLRYLRYMQNHPCPVNIQNPSIENFIQHIDYRREIENASPNALKHEYKAIQMLLRAYGIQPWHIKLPTPPKHSLRILPMPNTVHKFFNHQYSKDPYENKLYQYLYYHSFLIGWRTPNEPAILKTQDIIFNDDNTGYITITETKKGHRQRTIMPEKEILTDYRRKSIKNWLNHWRPKVENQYSKDYFYLQPSGKPFTTTHLGHRLCEKGKNIWPHFRSYDMRHWCAIARLIQEKHENKIYDAYIIKNWLGHEEITTTMNYIQHAEQYYRQAPYNWIKRVLKNHHQKMIEENSEIQPQKSINTKKQGSSTKNPSRNQNGPAETQHSVQKEKKSINTKNPLVSKSQPPSFSFSFDLITTPLDETTFVLNNPLPPAPDQDHVVSSILPVTTETMDVNGDNFISLHTPFFLPSIVSPFTVTISYTGDNRIVWYADTTQSITCVGIGITPVVTTSPSNAVSPSIFMQSISSTFVISDTAYTWDQHPWSYGCEMSPHTLLGIKKLFFLTGADPTSLTHSLLPSNYIKIGLFNSKNICDNFYHISQSCESFAM